MDNVRPWLVLKSVPGIGNHLIKRLIDRFKTPESIFQASRHDLIQVSGISERLIPALQAARMTDGVARECDRLANSPYRIVPLTDPAYPPLLREIPDPPPYLYVFGRLEPVLSMIAVVGSRHATDYGKSATRRIARDLALRGITVVSGMARGIDTAAHQGALMAGAPTIAVLGSGLENIYPAENRTLYGQIARQGAVVSEFPLAAEPDAHHFPMRNRIISGMTLGTIVAEATRNSGSLITARLAAEQGREVFAIPGSVHSFKSTGTHSLIKQGAKLVENAQDIIEELLPLAAAAASPPPTGQPAPSPPLSAEESLVARALEPYPTHIDDLIRKTGLDAGNLLGLLLALELKGVVRQSTGKMFTLSEP